jgi:hypothetical protein
VKKGRILGGLRFDASEGTFGLRLDRANGLAVEIEQVIREAETGFHREISDSDSAPSGQIEFVAVLDNPARRHQIGVDLPSGSLLGRFRHAP